jgi:hypothetical protein
LLFDPRSQHQVESNGVPTVGLFEVVVQQYAWRYDFSDHLLTLRGHSFSALHHHYHSSFAHASGLVSAQDPPGIDYADFWDDLVFAPRGISITDGLHCPALLAAAEGLSPAIKLPGIVEFLSNAQPFFFLMGEQLASQVLTMARFECVTFHAWFGIPDYD